MGSRRPDGDPSLLARVRWANLARLFAVVGAGLLIAVGPRGCSGAEGGGGTALPPDTALAPPGGSGGGAGGPSGAGQVRNGERPEAGKPSGTRRADPRGGAG